jgi:uncharacterized coiled-coil DUF342 family protein
LNALERLSRRRRERRNHAQPAHPFAVETCEYLTDGAFALLRVSGTGSCAPVALVTQGDKPESFDPLPQPDAGVHNGAWHTAFALPAEVAEPGSRLWLHDGGVYLADLLVPAPARATAEEADAPASPAEAAAPPAEFAPAADNDPRARKLVEAWSEAATLRERLSDREEELAEALRELLDLRKDRQPLRDQAEEVAGELADARAELELVYKHAREARLRATEKAAELDALRTELETLRAESRSGEADPTEAGQELAELREQVKRLEQEQFDAEVERTRLAALVEVQKSEEPAEVDGSRKSRRRSFGRRNDDRAAQRGRAALEAQLAERGERIEQLEKEAESFAARREEAVSESMKERIAELEHEVRQHATCTDDLRALLTSERELVATARREAHELKQQLATARAGRVADSSEPPATPVLEEPAVRRAPIQPPPWSALDDELLARIEKAKSMTG